MLDAAWQEGVAHFNAGRWWEAHESWEDPWMRARGEARGDERAFLQALILLAAALHKRWHHGSLSHRNLFKADAYLARLPGVYGGLDLGGLRAQVWAALNEPGLSPQIVVAVPGEHAPAESTLAE
ncbi:DUF309 domain-containing protein [Deinococcus koreensis]|uniref:DUF309 domain-containing protein n=2 Tax=Deinococcus koreensis TaxID=2054903 RepID=A0A2K3V2M1_9DEIO|nr:DUF309 domain-containing protein [Deinococcus koreensis]